MATVTDHEVPRTEAPAASCRYCGRPFRRQVYHDLHLGHAHSEVLTDAERTAHERATETEADELFLLHLKALAWLSALYAVFVLGYMVAAV